MYFKHICSTHTFPLSIEQIFKKFVNTKLKFSKNFEFIKVAAGLALPFLLMTRALSYGHTV
jgi:hypothetical protein